MLFSYEKLEHDRYFPCRFASPNKVRVRIALALSKIFVCAKHKRHYVSETMISRAYKVGEIG